MIRKLYNAQASLLIIKCELEKMIDESFVRNKIIQKLVSLKGNCSFLSKLTLKDHHSCHFH
jgi:hypothetical protein